MPSRSDCSWCPAGQYPGKFTGHALELLITGRLKTQVLENASTEKASTDRKGGNRKYGKDGNIHTENGLECIHTSILEISLNGVR